MVGTNPRRSPLLRAPRQAPRISEIVVRILMLRRRRRLWGTNTAKRQPLQGQRSWGRHSDAERTSKGREPTSTHHYGDIRLECPDQGNDPPNHCPPEEEVQKHNRGRVALAAGEDNDGGQKIHHEAHANERKQKERGDRHTSHLLTCNLTLFDDHASCYESPVSLVPRRVYRRTARFRSSTISSAARV